MADAEPFSSGGRLFASAARRQQQQRPAAPVRTATASAAAPVAAPVAATTTANASAEDEGDSKDPAVVAERLCRRGNAAFAAGKYLRAGELYRRALDALEASSSAGDRRGGESEASAPPRRPPLPGAGKLHSNLAAVALQLGRPRAALASCAAALQAEPTFGRAAVRAATCHVRLGEWDSAERALAAAEEAAALGLATATAAAGVANAPSEGAVAERDRVLADAAAKRAELAQLRAGAEEAVAAADAFVEGVKTSSAASAPSNSSPNTALSKLSAFLAAGASPYALSPRASRARLLLALGRPADAAAAAAPACAEEAEGGEAAWQGWVRVQAAFFEGRLGDAAAALEARAQAGDDDDDDDENEDEEEDGDENDDGSGGDEEKKSQEKKKRKKPKHPRGLAPPSAAAAAEAAAALRSLLAARSEGNAAYAASRFADAEAAYSRALLGRVSAAVANGNGPTSSSSNQAAAALAPPPPAFAALLLANRGAARARAGDVAGALSDCLSARALAPGYAKAAARAGDLLSEVGLLDAACREYEEGLAAVTASRSSSSSSPSSSSLSSSSSTTDAALASSLRSKLQTLSSWIARSAQARGGSQQQQQQVDSFKLLGLHQRREKAAEEAAQRLRSSHWYGRDSLRQQASAEVARAISDADVRAAYRKAALAHHPDKAVSRLRLSDALCGAFGAKLLAVSATAAEAAAEASSSSSSSLSLHSRLREAADFVFKAVGQARDALADASGREAEDRRLTAAAEQQARALESPPSHQHHYSHHHSVPSYEPYGYDDFSFDARQQRAWEAAATAQAAAQAHMRRPYAW